jgi:hypothetical protein
MYVLIEHGNFIAFFYSSRTESSLKIDLKIAAYKIWTVIWLRIGKMVSSYEPWVQQKAVWFLAS